MIKLNFQRILFGFFSSDQHHDRIIFRPGNFFGLSKLVLFLIISAFISPSLLFAQSKTEVLDPSSHTTYSVNASPVAD
jgi:hypothetical protein